MAVSFRLYGTVRTLVGSGEFTLDWEGGTLGELIDRLAERFGTRVKEELLDEEGNLDYSFMVMAGEERLQSLSAPVPAGREIVITNLFAGGERAPLAKEGVKWQK